MKVSHGWQCKLKSAVGSQRWLTHETTVGKTLPCIEHHAEIGIWGDAFTVLNILDYTQRKPKVWHFVENKLRQLKDFIEFTWYHQEKSIA